jgi:hypothetical protein
VGVGKRRRAFRRGKMALARHALDIKHRAYRQRRRGSIKIAARRGMSRHISAMLLARCASISARMRQHHRQRGSASTA